MTRQRARRPAVVLFMSVLLLGQQQVEAGNEARQGLQEPGPRRAVHHLVIDGEGEADLRDEAHAPPFALRSPGNNGADPEDPDLRRIQHRREVFNAEPAQVGDGERAAGKLIRGNAAFAAGRRKPGGFRGNCLEAKDPGVADDGDDEPPRRINGKTQVDVRVLPDQVAGKMRVQVRVPRRARVIRQRAPCR